MTASAPGTRPTHGSDAALRLCVLGVSGRLDLTVPYGTDVATLAAAYAAELGAERPGSVQPPSLVSTSGRRLDPGARVDDVATHGEVLVAVPAPGPDRAQQSSPWTRQPDPARPGLTTASLAVAAGCAAVAAATMALALSAGTRPGVIMDVAQLIRPLVAGLLLLGAVAVILPLGSAEGTSRWAFLVGPAVAAAAGFTVAWSTAPGGALLAVAAAGLGAVVASAIARTWLTDERESLARAWLLGGGLVAAAAVLALVLGAGALGLATVLLAAAVTAVGLLPSLVVDVPDDVLLDLDRLAVTAWSARERPRGGRRRHQVRPRFVQEVAGRSTRAVSAGVALCALLAALTGPVVLAGAESELTVWARWAGVAMVALGGILLALISRGFRSLLPRLVLGVTALWLTALSAGTVLMDLGAPGRWYVFASAGVIAPLLLVVAVALGRGWRSVWWSRVGEILETLCGVLLIALVPVASGLFDVVRLSVAT